MQDGRRLAAPRYVRSWQEEMSTIAEHITEAARGKESGLRILEAGCGHAWGVDLKGVQYELTGIDNDERALDTRKNQRKDLDVAILGDLRTATLEEAHYDVIYNCNVLEHIDGAERVLENFNHWLKPGGILILCFPNRDSVKGVVTRTTPFWVHVLYKKHIQGYKNAGKPGHDPFPTFFDRIVSRRGIHEFYERNNLVVRAEYSAGHGRPENVAQKLLKLCTWIVHIASFGTWSAAHHQLMYVLEKPQATS